MQLLKEILSLSKGLLADPEPQMRKIFDGKTSAAAPAAIYLVYIAAYSLFLSVKPPDFPAEFDQLGLGTKSAAFYFFTHICGGTALEAATAALLLYFLRTFREGVIFFKALGWTLGMLACAWAVSYANSALFSLILSAAAVFFIIVIIRRERTVYWTFFQTALAVNLAAAVLLPLDFVSVRMRSENLYIIAEIASGLWMLVLFTKAARIFTGTSVPKAVIALAAGCAAVLLLLHLIHAAGVISGDVYATLLVT